MSDCIIVEIEKADARLQKSRTDESRTWYVQEGLVELGRERRTVNFRLEDGQSPYAPGRYEVDLLRSVGFSRWGDLEFKFSVQLKPVKTISAVPSAASK